MDNSCSSLIICLIFVSCLLGNGVYMIKMYAVTFGDMNTQDFSLFVSFHMNCMCVGTSLFSSCW